MREAPSPRRTPWPRERPSLTAERGLRGDFDAPPLQQTARVRAAVRAPVPNLGRVGSGQAPTAMLANFDS